MILFLLAVFPLIGCAGQTATGSTPTTASTPAPPPTTAAASPPTPIPPLVGSAAPDFAFKLFQGEDQLRRQELRLSELDGRPIVLNFWARFCGPCWTEMPELQEFYEEYSGELILLGIDVGQFTGLGSPKDAGRLLGSQERALSGWLHRRWALHIRLATQTMTVSSVTIGSERCPPLFSSPPKAKSFGLGRDPSPARR